jgi:phosphoenolpyruvate carboxykinase (ATP)
MAAKQRALFTPGRELVEELGITPSAVVYRNLDVDALYQAAVHRGRGEVIANGALHQLTAPYVGRAAKSSFYVRDEALRLAGHSLDELIAWGDASKGNFNNLPIGMDVYERLEARVKAHLSKDGDLYVTDAMSGRTPASRLLVRVVTAQPVAALFARNIFLHPSEARLAGFAPGWTLLHAPEVDAEPSDGTNGTAFIITNIGRRTTIIGGTRYLGQIKKAIFCVQNLLLPLKGVLTMHAGVSEGDTGLTAIHAGLSGTGKTTLSNTGHPVADDQIVVEIDGPEDAIVSNMEGGQYAKTEKLNAQKEPETWFAIGFGTTAENLKVGPDGHPDYDDTSLTENGRVGYPLEFVPNAKPTGLAGAPANITFLTADGFGVLPPVARLSVEAGMFHFAAGFTSKMPGTERGVTEPVPTFSAFFGKPFMPLKPVWYTSLLRRLIETHNTQIWLVNTGWLGPLRPGRQRVDILISKAIVAAVRDGVISLDEQNYWYDPVFKLHVPKVVPGVPSELLDPRNAWVDRAAYAEASNKLAAIFQRALGGLGDLPEEVVAACPAPIEHEAASQ